MFNYPKCALETESKICLNQDGSFIRMIAYWNTDLSKFFVITRSGLVDYPGVDAGNHIVWFNLPSTIKKQVADDY
jgi:hypothetical protein